MTGRGGQSQREVRLAEAFVEIAAALTGDFDRNEFMARLTDLAVDLLEISAAGVLICDEHNELHLLASSSNAEQLAELVEVQQREGPCYEVLQDAEAVAEHDLADTGMKRWPEFTPKALELGFGSVYAFPMVLVTNRLGALNLFASDPRGLDQGDEQVAQGLANFTTIGLTQRRHLEAQTELANQLQDALRTRVVIEQAKGMIADQLQTSIDEAFKHLRSAARSNNLHIHRLASAVVDQELSGQDLVSDDPLVFDDPDDDAELAGT